MSALADEIRTAVREALREELPRILQELRPAANDPGHLLGVGAAAKRLGLAISTLYKMAAKCELPSHKLKGRLLFALGDLEAYAEARRRSPERVADIAAEALRQDLTPPTSSV